MNRSNKILFGIVFSFVFHYISAQEYPLYLENPEMGGEEIGVLVASIRIVVKVTQRFSYDDHVSCEVVEPKSYDYQSEPYWKPPDSFSHDQLRQIKMQHFDPKSSKNRIKVDGSIGTVVALGCLAKDLYKKVASLFEDEYCNCDKCNIQSMSYADIANLYKQFLQKYKIKKIYYDDPVKSMEKAWESLDFHKLDLKAQELLKQRFAEAQRQRDAAERQRHEAVEAQKKAEADRKKKEAEKIQKKSFQEIMQLSKNDFLFSSGEVVEEQITPWAKRISRRTEAIKCVLANKGNVLTKRFQISHEVVEFLKSNQCDVTPYLECQGNELQHVLHHEFLQVVLNIADLSQDEAAREVQQFQKLLLSCSQDGCSLNKQGHVIDAMSLSDFCQSALNAGCTTLRARITQVDGQVHTELEAIQENALQCVGQLNKDLLSKECLQEFSSSFEAARKIAEYRENENSDYPRTVDDVFSEIATRAQQVFSEKKTDQQNPMGQSAVQHCLEWERGILQKRRELVQKQSLEQMPELHVRNEDLLEALAVEGAPPWYDCELWNERAQKYKQAMDRELSGEQTFRIKTFPFSDAFKNLVDGEGIKGHVFAYFEGNELQQVLHEGFVEDIQAVAQLETEHLSSDEKELLRSFQSLVVSFAECGSMHNKAGDVESAWNLANICGVIRDYSKAVSLGVWDGVVDTAEIFMHPIDTVCNISAVLYFAGSQTAALSYDCLLFYDGLLSGNEEQYKKAFERIDAKLDVAKQTLGKVWEEIQNSSGPDRTRFIARMATGIVLQKPSFRLAGRLLKEVKRVKDVVVRSRQAVEFANNVGRMGTRSLKGVRQAAGGVANAVRNAVLPPLARARLILRKACGDCKKLIEEGKCFFEEGCACCRGVVANTERTLVRLLEDCHPRFAQLVESGCEMRRTKAVVDKIKLGLSEIQFMRLRRFFDTVVETSGSFRGAEIPRRLVLEESFWRHIFTGELEVLMESSGDIIKKLSGFHHDLHWKDVGKGLLELTNKTYIRGRHILQADLAGSIRKVTKTFFPKHWSSKKVAEKIIEALKNIEMVEEATGRGLSFVGKTKCGIKIQFFAEETGKLLTAFPLI